MSMVWSMESPTCPWGNTVSTPPTSRSFTVITRPEMSTNRLPRRQCVVSKVSFGSGPSDRRSGKASTTPMTAAPSPSSPPRKPRRRNIDLARPLTAAVMASISASVEAWGWRSSTNGPLGKRYLPQADNPNPKQNSPAPRKIPSSWVWPPCQ